MLNQEDIQGFFFDAMVTRSWARGDEGTPIANMPDWRQIAYEHVGRGLKLVDRWGKDNMGRPAGSTLISVHDVPAWVMRYGEGRYPQSALPFLRTALMTSYKNRKFCGGRGASIYCESGMLYTNFAEGDFNRFRFREMVLPEGQNKPYGYHVGWGGSLLYNDIE